MAPFFLSGNLNRERGKMNITKKNALVVAGVLAFCVVACLAATGVSTFFQPAQVITITGEPITVVVTVVVTATPLPFEEVKPTETQVVMPTMIPSVTPIFTNVPPATSTVAVPSVATATKDPSCAQAPASLLRKGMQAIVMIEPHNVRKTPYNGALVIVLKKGDMVKIMSEKPTCKNEVLWWEIQTGDKQGWTSEARGNDHYIVPVGVSTSAVITPVPKSLPTVVGGCETHPSYLTIGSQATVADKDNHALEMYPAPNEINMYTAGVPVREIVTVIDGPVCAGGITWVKILYGKQVAWAEEANVYGAYNLLPVSK